MSPSNLAVLLDGHGYTACCYAAILGSVSIAGLMMKKNPNRGTARDRNNMTPLYKAALRENKKMVSYFLKFAEIGDLSKEEWFDILLLTICTKFYDVALQILEKNASLATMTSEHGTALHLLARQDKDVITRKQQASLEVFGWTTVDRKKQSNFCLLAQKLWTEIQRLEKSSVLELIRKRPILHDAAKAGNVELITMLTADYPDLVWDTDGKGYTIFHIAVIHRQEKVFSLIRQIGAMKDFVTISQDEKGNNILHLAAKLAPLKTGRIESAPILQMQRELAWFKEVEAVVPPSCLEMRNRKGHRPREFFSMQHKSLLEKSETWMRNTTDSCMLVATIILTVVFAAAFTAPGGYNSETGIPVLLKSNLFVCFVGFEVLAVFGSIFSIIMFWSIIASSFREDQLLKLLPYFFNLGLSGLMISLIGALSAFMSTYFLVFHARDRFVNYIVASIYLWLVSLICSKIANLWARTNFRVSRIF